MSYTKPLAMAAVMLVFFGACKKDKKIEPVTPPQPVEQASVSLDFNAIANNRPMSPDTAWYVTAAGDVFVVNKFNYYISNVKFIRNDGFVMAEPESYHIIRHVEKQTSFTVNGIAEGTYTSVEFLIGIDSVRNSSGAQTGALDVSQGMYWDWLTGYVFFKLEGEFKSTNFNTPTGFAMHIGTTPNAKKCSFTLANPIVARKGKLSQVHYIASLDKVFSDPDTLDMDTYHAVTGGRQAGTIANNYKNMFSVSGVENN